MNEEIQAAVKEYYTSNPDDLESDIKVLIKLLHAYKAYAELHNNEDAKYIDKVFTNPQPLYDYWDVIGWIDPAINLWHLLGDYNLADTNTGSYATIFVNDTCKFMKYYMNKYLAKYSYDKHSEHYWYKFSATGDDDQWDDYVVALFLVVDWIVYMIDEYKEKINTLNFKEK